MIQSKTRRSDKLRKEYGESGDGDAGKSERDVCVRGNDS